MRKESEAEPGMHDGGMEEGDSRLEGNHATRRDASEVLNLVRLASYVLRHENRISVTTRGRRLL